MKALLYNRPFTFYYVLAVSIASLVWIYIMAMEIVFANLRGDGFSLFAQFYETQQGIVASNPMLHHHSDSVILFVATYIAMPVAFAGFFFPFAPTLAALIVTAWGWGKSGLSALLGAFMPVRGNISLREGLSIYALLLGVVIALVALSFLRVFMLGDQDRIAGFSQHLAFFDWRYFLTAWLVALFLNQGAFLEELGWRTFALPILIRRLGSPLMATLLLGVLWALWHMPREVPLLLTGQQTIPDLLQSQFWFILHCCSASIVITYFVNISGGSVIPAIMLHGVLNFFGGMFVGEMVGARSAFTAEAPVTWLIAAIVVLVLAGPQLGWKRRLEVHGRDGSTDPSRIWSDPDYTTAPASHGSARDAVVDQR